MLTVDGRCGCAACEERTQNIYRMVGSCSNCGTDGIFIIYRAGDSRYDQVCPVCECSHTVRSANQRLATPDEVPAA